MDDKHPDAPSPIEASGAPARNFAPLPSLEFSDPPGWRRAAVATVIIIALLASGAAALALTGRLSGAVVLPGSGATLNATQAAQRAARAFPPQYAITALSMDSSTDGWAIMVNQVGDAGLAIVLHITNGTVVQQTALKADFGGQVVLQALSPTNVWALSAQRGYVFSHYDGHSWAQVSLPVPTGAQGDSVSAGMFHMISPSEGWAIASYTPGSPQGAIATSNQVFYRYDGSSWRIEPAERAATVGSVTDAAASATSRIQITGISATPGGDAWATGYALIQKQNADGNLTNSVTAGFIYHREGGVWRLAQTLPNDELYGITMTGPAAGWIIGMRDLTKRAGGVIAPYTVVIQTAIALGWNGARWSPAPIPQPDQSQPGLHLTRIAASSPSSVWIAGLPGGESHTDATGAPYASDNSYLIHYDGAHWARVNLPQIAAINQNQAASAVNTVSFGEMSLTPSGDLWMAGALSVYQSPNFNLFPLLYRYSGGQWTNIPLPAITSTSGAPSSAGQPAG